MLVNFTDAELSQSQEVRLQHALFAGGCFWCMQPAFDMLEGVIRTQVGYIGGDKDSAHYGEVSSGTTGHREAIEVTYNPEVIDYETILETYWQSIDPFDNGGQFFDRGDQYRTAIYPLDADQRAIAEASKSQLQEEFAPKIVATDILEPIEFFPAEDYHQGYYQKSSQRYKAYKNASGREHKLKEIWQN